MIFAVALVVLTEPSVRSDDITSTNATANTEDIPIIEVQSLVFKDHLDGTAIERINALQEELPIESDESETEESTPEVEELPQDDSIESHSLIMEEDYSADEYELPQEVIPEAETTYPIYDAISHTSDEERMLQCIVECEAYGSTLEHKQVIACVVVNRLNSDKWDYDSLLEVMTAKNQFSTLSNYYNTYREPNEDTIEAVRSVLSGEVDIDSLSQGAVFFYSPKYAGYQSYFENKTFLFEIEGNRFFK
jgi:hypothetical protein